MMSKISDALFTPSHSVVLVPLVWISLGLFIADKAGWYEPDYHRIVGVFIIGYFVSILIELGSFRGRLRRH